MAQERYIHSNKVMFEKEAEEGARYLDSKLDNECAKVFFVYAKNYKVAPFEDQNGRRYELSYDNSLYVLTKSLS